MMTKYRLDKSFGPVGTTAGSVLFVAGLIVTFNSVWGILPVLLGAFVGFSSTCTIIDFDKKRIKFSNDLFGIIHTGKWIAIENSMKLGIKETDMTWSAYSRGNRPFDIEKKDFRITLFDAKDLEILQVKKNNSLESAKADLEIIASQLGIASI
jgi:hypothetical protein